MIYFICNNEALSIILSRLSVKCLRVLERERERVCVCVRKREKERERENDNYESLISLTSMASSLWEGLRPVEEWRMDRQREGKRRREGGI